MSNQEDIVIVFKNQWQMLERAAEIFEARVISPTADVQDNYTLYSRALNNALETRIAANNARIFYEREMAKIK